MQLLYEFVSSFPARKACAQLSWMNFLIYFAKAEDQQCCEQLCVFVVSYLHYPW